MTCDIVVPTIREDQIKTFLEAWKFERPIVVWDNEETWDKIFGDFGEDAWIFSRRNAAIRCYGYLKSSADVIVTLDDDCLPKINYVRNSIGSDDREKVAETSIEFTKKHLDTCLNI